MEIFLEKRAVKHIRLSAEEAIEEGETDTLREDIAGVFSDEQIEEIERRIDSGDFHDFLAEILDEWSVEDVDELMELLEGQLADAGIDLKYTAQDLDDEDDEDDEEDEEDEEDDDALEDDAFSTIDEEEL